MLKQIRNHKSACCYILLNLKSVKSRILKEILWFYCILLHWKQWNNTNLQRNPVPSLMLLLLLSRFSRVRLCATPETAAHQVPPSPGFSRQGHCSGLPFPSPMHESEKWKWSRSVVSDSVRPQRRQPTRFPHPWDSLGKNTGVGCHFLLQCMKVKSESEVTQSCPTLSNPVDCSLPGSSVYGIFQARVLEWGAIEESQRKAMPKNVQTTAKLHSSHTLVK